jgi:hypothetical protein
VLLKLDLRFVLVTRFPCSSSAWRERRIVDKRT